MTRCDCQDSTSLGPGTGLSPFVTDKMRWRSGLVQVRFLFARAGAEACASLELVATAKFGLRLGLVQVCDRL